VAIFRPSMHYHKKKAGSIVHKHTSHAWERMGSAKILVLPRQLCHHNAYKGTEELRMYPCDQQVPANMLIVLTQNEDTISIIIYALKLSSY